MTVPYANRLNVNDVGVIISCSRNISDIIIYKNAWKPFNRSSTQFPNYKILRTLKYNQSSPFKKLPR